MSTLEATISMLEVMPEEAQRKVFLFTQDLFGAKKPASPFTPVTEQQVLDDLSASREQIAQGRGVNMADGLRQMGKEHGFI
jgi:hypothetical protein